MEHKYILYLALIIIFTKALGLLMRRIGLPEVIGALLSGFILGPLLLGIVEPNNVLKILADIGVIMLIFTAGLETNISQIKKTGVKSVIIALGGIILPLIAGFLLATLFNGGFDFDRKTLVQNLLIGVILTATSISIVVQTLKEMGKLKSETGTIILSAAIIDDILGVLLLSIVLSLNNADISPWISIGKTFAFFAAASLVGILLHYLFKKLSVKYPKHRRVPIFALGICLLYAYVADSVFGIADITGAYIAGLIFSGINATTYIERKIDINAYMIFTPVFFAYIGIQASFSDFNTSLIWFMIAFILVGIISKALGCYLASRLCHLGRRDSMVIGIGMIARGEVALVMMQKGITAGIIDSSSLTIVVGLVIVTSFISPILLKLTNKRNNEIVPLESS